ncbi:site-specific DNA-methyltransferase [Paenibacillus sp. P2(2022)]|uniref:DNA-methyltransferase n=1 Tax=Paenibacillus sp. P2(2022) TaxID=2917813 RepID=UPI00240565DC|nr:site-specific DNA-methyltransferase [Paenibacillus sp. P2(2022)]MDG0056965.1 site-specific DNA-methyltransferase [Paenibacillus sp. P2(2022)]
MILHGNNIEVMPTLPAGSFHTCVTSPPYWGLRDYGLEPSYWPEVTYTPMPGLPPVTVPEWTGCLGMEPTPEMYIAHIVLTFREVWRLLRSDGTLWLNLGDTYAGSGKGAWKNKTAQKEVYVIEPGSALTKIPKIPTGLKNKDLVGIPWRAAFALQSEGWYLRMDNIWHKPNPMPESVTDRTAKAHEYVFQLNKSEQYYFDHEVIKEPLAESSISRLAQDLEGQTGSSRANGGAKTNGAMKAVGNGETRNKRSVWTVATANFSEAHYAVFPEELIEPCILASSPPEGWVLDPFGGRATTMKVTYENNRQCTVIEMSAANVDIAKRYTAIIQPSLF